MSIYAALVLTRGATLEYSIHLFNDNDQSNCSYDKVSYFYRILEVLPWDRQLQVAFSTNGTRLMLGKRQSRL